MVRAVGSTTDSTENSTMDRATSSPAEQHHGRGPPTTTPQKQHHGQGYGQLRGQGGGVGGGRECVMEKASVPQRVVALIPRGGQALSHIAGNSQNHWSLWICPEDEANTTLRF